MIISMTAFARIQLQRNWGILSCEIKSLNSRYLDISLCFPEGFSKLEAECFQYLRQHLERGKILCSVRLHSNNNQLNQLTVNHEIVKSIVKAYQDIVKYFPGDVTLNVLDILQWPGVVSTSDIVSKDDVECVFPDLLAATVQELLAAASREGAKLQTILLQRLSSIEDQLRIIKHSLPNVLQGYQQKLESYVASFPELTIKDLAHDLMVFAQKIDISEEIDRLEIHVAEVKRLLLDQSCSSIGRKLNFLMQELQRESNTLSVKSIDINITYAALEIKVLVEQLREQIQNIV